MAERIPQSVAKRVVLKVFLTSDHISAATGKTVAVVISKNGGAFGNPSGGATNATEIANGWYYVDLSTTDTGTTGPLIVRGTAASCDDSEPAPFEVVNAHNAGFDGVPAATYNTAGGAVVIGTTANTFKSDSSARMDLGEVLGVAVTPTAILDANVLQFGGVNGTFTGGRPEVNTTHLAGTLNTGTAGYVGIDWGAIANKATANNLSATNINVCGSTGSVDSLPAGAITTSTFDPNAIDAAAFGQDAAAKIAAAWGSSIVGNGRTRDYFLQGGTNLISFAVDGLSWTIYQTDDTTPLKTGTSTRNAATIGPLRSVDPA